MRAAALRLYATYRFPESLTRIPRRALEKVFPSLAAPAIGPDDWEGGEISGQTDERAVAASVPSRR
jgi:hypothetical protein